MAPFIGCVTITVNDAWMKVPGLIPQSGYMINRFCTVILSLTKSSFLILCATFITTYISTFYGLGLGASFGVLEPFRIADFPFRIVTKTINYLQLTFS